MRVLGIETSCDETAAAVVESTGDPRRPWRVRSNVIASQTDIHREWGGVVPELASRQHIRDICAVVDRALIDGGGGSQAYDGVAVTQGPGLVGALLIGVSFAKSLAWARGVPLVAVHHLAGHIESLVVENGELPQPAVVLVVSGGHTSLFRVKRAGEYREIGRTRDDAAGEAYDKVAKLLGLGYPGGPIVDRLAQQGNDRAIGFPRARLTHADRNARTESRGLDFSFSGLKTAVRRYVETRRDALKLGPGDMLPEAEILDVCASFQRVVVETLLDRLFGAAAQECAEGVGIAGGVSANSRLRSAAAERGMIERVPVFVPRMDLSTDNAAMIAAAGLRRMQRGLTAGWDLNAEATLAL